MTVMQTKENQVNTIHIPGTNFLRCIFTLIYLSILMTHFLKEFCDRRIFEQQLF
jgi:hypothetical protein